jgi:hypothetical protein
VVFELGIITLAAPIAEIGFRTPSSLLPQDRRHNVKEFTRFLMIATLFLISASAVIWFWNYSRHLHNNSKMCSHHTTSSVQDIMDLLLDEQVVVRNMNPK